MLEFVYQSGWGAYAVLLFFQLPFMLVFLYVVFQKSVVNPQPSDTAQAKISRVRGIWLTAVIMIFLVINIVSIQYMPAVSSAQAANSGQEIQDVDVTAVSWSFDISEQEFVAGRPVRFSAGSADTVHGFAVYHPNGKILFTMMLVPGVKKSSLIYTFQDPGTYKVRCLEYCGAAHHDMSDELTVTAAES